MKSTYWIVLFLVGYYPLDAQLLDNHWLIGYEFAQPPVIGNAYGLTNLSFNSGTLNIEGPIDDGTANYLNNASISNEDGDLVAYTNGLYIKNSDYQLMTGGDTLNRTIIETNQELHYKSTDVAIQGTLFLPYPGHPDSVLLFYTGDSYNGNVGTFNQDLSMAIIHTAAQGGGGEVVQKEIPVIVDDTLTFGKLTAVKHANGRDWWILIQSNKGAYYYSILVDPSGVHVGGKVNNDTLLAYPGGGGQARFSPDGTQYAIFGGRSTQSGSWLHVFSFDRCIGRLSNRRSVYYPPKTNYVFFGGISFSPNSRFLYHSLIDTIFQYDTQANDLLSTREKVIIREPHPSGALLTYFQSQLAPDGKIYLCSTSGMPFIHVIHNPDEPGFACQPQTIAFRLPTVNSQAVPNHPNYRLGPLDGSSCDTLGIDNLPQAWWRYGQDTLDSRHVSFHDLSYYEPTWWNWDFGDGATSTIRHPEHTYATLGMYQVCLTVGNAHGSNTHCKTINAVSATQNLVLQAAIQVGPNPFDQRLILTLSTPLAGPRLRVFDLTGQIKMDMPIMMGINECDTHALPAGAYLWQVITRSEGVVKTGKLVKL